MSLYCVRGLTVADVRRERIPLLCSTAVRETALAKDFVLTWGIRSMCVSAKERSCLKGVYTVRRSEK